MKTSERFKEYIWLIDLLKTYGGITFEEINEEWLQTEMSGGVKMRVPHSTAIRTP